MAARVTIQSYGAAHSLCWFCGQEPKKDSCALPVVMRKKLSTSHSGPLVTTRWEVQTIKVPRCQVCKEEAAKKKQAVWLALGPYLLVLGTLVILVQVLDESTIDRILPIGLPTGLTFLALGGIAAVIVAKRVGRRIAKNSKRNHPAIRELLDHGWHFRNW